MLLLVANWCLILSPPNEHQTLSTHPSDHDSSEISLIPTPPKLGPLSITYWHHTHGFKLSSRRGSYHIILGLLLSGQVEPNPGPRPPKYPCGKCRKAVTWGKPSIQCDHGSIWYHKGCLQMSSANFEAHVNCSELSWICCSCALPNSSLLFDSFTPQNTSIDSSIDSSPGPPSHQSSPVYHKRKKNLVKRLKIQVINFDSIYAKRNVLSASVLDDDPDIIIGCETHLDNSIFDSEIVPPNYKACRNDRNRQGGGVILLHKQDLDVRQIRCPNDSEFIAAKVACQGKKPLIVCAAYRPPNNNRGYMNTLCSHIKEVYDSFPGHAIWCGGDFNLPDINWLDESTQGNRVHSEINKSLLDLLHSFNLTQVVNFPTRINNTLEILFSNRPNLVHKLRPIPGISDHDTIA